MKKFLKSLNIIFKSKFGIGKFGIGHSEPLAVSDRWHTMAHTPCSRPPLRHQHSETILRIRPVHSVSMINVQLSNGMTVLWWSPLIRLCSPTICWRLSLSLQGNWCYHQEWRYIQSPDGCGQVWAVDIYAIVRFGYKTWCCLDQVSLRIFPGNCWIMLKIIDLVKTNIRNKIWYLT